MKNLLKKKEERRRNKEEVEEEEEERKKQIRKSENRKENTTTIQSITYILGLLQIQKIPQQGSHQHLFSVSNSGNNFHSVFFPKSFHIQHRASLWNEKFLLLEKSLCGKIHFYIQHIQEHRLLNCSTHLGIRCNW
jgi:hypothetical protein